MKAVMKEQYVVGPKGEKKAVILDLERYRRLLEDYHDLQVIACRKENIKVSAPDFVARLKKNGRL